MPSWVHAHTVQLPSCWSFGFVCFRNVSPTFVPISGVLSIDLALGDSWSASMSGAWFAEPVQSRPQAPSNSASMACHVWASIQGRDARGDNLLNGCTCMYSDLKEKVACGQHSVCSSEKSQRPRGFYCRPEACPLCEMKVQWLADERVMGSCRPCAVSFVLPVFC